MAVGPRFSVKFRRRREGRTDYARRKRLLAKGVPRLVVRKSNKYITAHIISYDKAGDRTSVFAHSSELKKLGWKHDCKNLPAAYLTGLLAGKKAIKAGIKEAMLDLGLHAITKGSRLFSALKGAVDAGLKVPHDPKMFPSEERITGKHISENLPKDFEEVRAKLSPNQTKFDGVPSKQSFDNDLAGPSRSEDLAKVNFSGSQSKSKISNRASGRVKRKIK